MSASEASAAVEWLLAQAEPEARRVAVQQITKVRGKEGAELLVRALGDDDWRVRKEAAHIAPVLEPRNEVVASLVAALDETINIGLRNAAVEALVAIGTDAVPPAIEALAKLDADGRKLAVEILGGVPELRGVKALARALSDDDANVRVAAAEALGNAAFAGDEAREIGTSALTDVLAASEIFLKLAALDALSRLDAKLPWSVFEPYVNDPLLRRHAIAAAAGSREKAAIAAVAKATGDSSPTVAREAVIALGDCIVVNPHDAETIGVARQGARGSPERHARLRAMARESDDLRLRAAALLVVGLLSDPADVNLLVDALGDDDVAERAEIALSLFGAGAITPLLAMAQGASNAQRAAILTRVGSLGSGRSPHARDAFREALGDADDRVVLAGVKGLAVVGDASDLVPVAPLVTHGDGRIAAAATSAIAQIAARHAAAARALLRDTDATGSAGAVGCAILRAIGPGSINTPQDVAYLQRALSNADPRTRRSSVEALALLGGDDAVEAVSFALADEDNDVQLASVRALGRLRRAEPLLDVVRAARDPALVAAALRALGDADVEQAFAAARPLVHHADAAIACAAVEAVGRLGGTRREDVLFEALDHPDAEVVKVALSEIASQPDVRVLARLGLCLDHASWEVRRLAAELLGQDGSTGAQALLRARYEREKDPMVREAIALAVSVRPPPDGFITIRAGSPAVMDEEDE
jgi:HEAT repeat protein